MNEVLLGDCLELMKNIPDKSIDMILCDLPYQVTARQKWDLIIPLDLLWDSYKRIVKENAAIVLTATEPFRTKLICSNLDWFKYDLIWAKNKSTGFLNAKKQPLRSHESILVFYNKQPVYHPQKTKGEPRKAGFKRRKETNSPVYGDTGDSPYVYTEERYPLSVLNFDVVNNDSKDRFHTAQKPVELMEYLIKTYSNEGDLVLDNTAGSGTTGVAARNLKRNFILIEKEEVYYQGIKKRLEIE